MFPTLRHTEASGYGDSVSEFYLGYLREQVGITDPTKASEAVNLLRKHVGGPLQGAIGGRDTTISDKGDGRLELSFVAEAARADAASAGDPDRS